MSKLFMVWQGPNTHSGQEKKEAKADVSKEKNEQKKKD